MGITHLPSENPVVGAKLMNLAINHFSVSTVLRALVGSERNFETRYKTVYKFGARQPTKISSFDNVVS